MSRAESDVTPRYFSRRILLGGMLTLGMESILPLRRENEIVREIKRFEHEISDKPVSLPEAHEYAPLISKLYVDFAQPEKTSKSFIEQTYMISPKDLITSELLPTSRNSYIQEHIMDTLSPERVIPILSSPDLLGITFSTGDMYVFLDRINELHATQQNDATSAHTQFHSLEPTVHCEPSTPITRLRQTLLHEHAHADLARINTDAHTKGFRIINTDGQIVDYFEEFFADFIAATISNKYDLPFNTGYGLEPVDYTNFQIILDQSGITHLELADMHRNSSLFTLINSINEGIKVERESEAYHEAVANVSKALFTRPNHHPDWSSVTEYFPEVDGREYQYNPPVTHYPESLQPLQGCILD